MGFSPAQVGKERRPRATPAAEVPSRYSYDPGGCGTRASPSDSLARLPRPSSVARVAQGPTRAEFVRQWAVDRRMVSPLPRRRAAQDATEERRLSEGAAQFRPPRVPLEGAQPSRCS